MKTDRVKQEATLIFKKINNKLAFLENTVLPRYIKNELRYKLYTSIIPIIIGVDGWRDEGRGMCFSLQLKMGQMSNFLYLVSMPFSIHIIGNVYQTEYNDPQKIFLQQTLSKWWPVKVDQLSNFDRLLSQIGLKQTPLNRYFVFIIPCCSKLEISMSSCSAVHLIFNFNIQVHFHSFILHFSEVCLSIEAKLSMCL